MHNVSYLMQGISLGLSFFLVASGLTLTMGLMRVVNMSHGAIYMIAGLCGITVYKATGNWFLAIIAAAVLGALLGLILEVGFLRRMYKSPPSQVLLTIGLIYILNNVALWIWKGKPVKPGIPEWLDFTVPIGSVRMPVFNFVIIGFGLIIFFLLWFLQDKTKVGAMVRAGMDNREIASTLGMNNKTIFTAVFVLGSLIAGLSAMIGGRISGFDANTSWAILLTSIIVVVIGGTGSIQGALIGGLLIGIIECFGPQYFPKISNFVRYILLIVVLLIKPAGLLGKVTDRNKDVTDTQISAPQGHASPLLGRSSSDLRVRIYKIAPYLVALLALVLIPIFTKSATHSLMTKILIYALFAMSLDIVMGFTGMRSFGHAAFLGMGGYTVGILVLTFHITSLWLILPIVVVVSAILSAVISYFTLRVSGVHFLLVTMAFGELLRNIAEKVVVVNGQSPSDGISSIVRPDLGFKLDWTSLQLYLFVLVFFVVCYIILHRFMRASFGRSLIGVRENNGRMRSLGFNTWGLKYFGMILAGVFAGVAGMLYAIFYRTVQPSAFGLEQSALPMLMVIMGGGASLWGPALGSAVILVVQSIANTYIQERWQLVLGVLYVLCVMFLQGGFSKYLTSFYNWLGSKFLKNVPIVEKITAAKEAKQ